MEKIDIITPLAVLMFFMTIILLAYFLAMVVTIPYAKKLSRQNETKHKWEEHIEYLCLTGVLLVLLVAMQMFLIEFELIPIR